MGPSRPARDIVEIEQVHELADTLEGGGLTCWLDAGSLLGVIRDGGLLPWDNDIDLGCWSSDLPAVNRVVRIFERHGYKAQRYAYRGLPYQVKLRPRLEALMAGARTIDLSLFRRSGSGAWCPINCVAPQPARRFGLKWSLQRPLREGVIRRWARDQNREARRTAFPRLRMDVRTWVVPEQFYARLDQVTLYGHTLHVPADPYAYLSLRYGEWRVPRQGWNYCEDDGILDRRPPEAVVGRL